MNNIMQNSKIFISYRRDGGGYAAMYLRTELNNLGYYVFLDVADLKGGDYPERIERELRECRVLLIILSQNVFEESLKNPEQDWIIREYSIMKEREKNGEFVKIIPLRLKNYEDPDRQAIICQIKGLSANRKVDQKKKKCLNYLLELLKETYMPFMDIRMLSGVLEELLIWMKVQPKDEEALRKSAEGNPIEMNKLALMYERGFFANSERNGLKEAYNYYCEAASYGNLCPAAMYNLGDIYERCSENPILLEEYGISVKEKGISDSEMVASLRKKAFEYYEKSGEAKSESMEHGYLPALYKLGNLYEDAKDYEKAFTYYKRASDFGYPHAHNAVGFYYRNGIHGEKDVHKAKKYYEKAQMAGILQGRYNFAKTIEASDIEGAIQQYEQLISEGIGDLKRVFYALASCYEKKANVNKSSPEGKRCLGKAMGYYQQAYDSGYGQACVNLEKCKERYLDGGV